MHTIIQEIEDRIYNLKQEERFTDEECDRLQEKSEKIARKISDLQEELTRLKNVIDNDGNFVTYKMTNE